MKPLIKSDVDYSAFGSVSVDRAAYESGSDPSTVQSATQDTQSSNETERSAVALSALPNPPAVSAMVDKQGRITPPWLIWFQKLSKRIGGTVSASTDDTLTLQAFQAAVAQSVDTPISFDINQSFGGYSPQILQFVSNSQRDEFEGIAPCSQTCAHKNPVKIAYLPTSTVTITNTAAETSMIAGTYLGSATLPANSLRVGSLIRIQFSGYVNTDAAPPSATLNVKMGGVTLASSTGTLPSGLTNVPYLFDFSIRVVSLGASGSVIGEGMTLISGGTGIATVSARGLLMTAASTIDTTVPMPIDVTYQFGTASTSNALVVVTGSIQNIYMR